MHHQVIAGPFPPALMLATLEPRLRMLSLNGGNCVIAFCVHDIL